MMGWARSGQTVGERLAASKGKTTGFDYLRAGLSTAVIVFHSGMTCYGPDINRGMETGWSRPFIAVILPAFFALSGFLVAGSLARCKTIFEFLTLRAVRLIPALFFEVLISAVIIGPLFTTFSLSEYFSDKIFYRYWLNIIGEIHFQLPGLFLSNPDPDIVNRQLWTIPVELQCYALLTLLAIIGIFQRKILLVVAFVGLVIISPEYDHWKGIDVNQFNNVPSKVMTQSFLAGVVIFSFRDKIPLNKWMFFVSLLIAYLVLIERNTAYLSALFISYATIFIGLTNTKPNVVSRVGEYSYGLYIYGYVIQQTFAVLFPNYRIWWLNCVVCVPVALLISFVSWKLVEYPSLRRRQIVVDLVDRLTQPFILGMKNGLNWLGTNKKPVTD